MSKKKHVPVVDLYPLDLTVKPARALKRAEILHPKFVKRMLSIVDEGLSEGEGDPKPGEMCIEAAIGYAAGEKFGDEPTCVDSGLRDFKIIFNDNAPWDDEKDRAKGLRRLGVAQLGTKGHFSANMFHRLMREMVWKDYLQEEFEEIVADASYSVDSTIFPESVGYGEKINFNKILEMNMKEFNKSCEGLLGGSVDKELENFLVNEDWRFVNNCDGFWLDWSVFIESFFDRLVVDPHVFAEKVVQILIKMKTPGSKFLYLTKAPKVKAKKAKR